MGGLTKKKEFEKHVVAFMHGLRPTTTPTPGSLMTTAAALQRRLPMSSDESQPLSWAEHPAEGSGTLTKVPAAVPSTHLCLRLSMLRFS